MSVFSNFVERLGPPTPFLYLRTNPHNPHLLWVNALFLRTTQAKREQKNSLRQCRELQLQVAKYGGDRGTDAGKQERITQSGAVLTLLLCRNCKARKVKCGEEKPRCSNCERLEEDCDYKIRLSWGGRPLKKKQMLNGEEQTEDDSMFLPGAGQFSIHQQFQQPQTYPPQPVPSNGTSSRKTPVVRTGRKSGGISSYQNVFSVAEPPTSQGPATPTPASPEENLQGSSQSSTSPPHRAGSQTYYSWPDTDHSQTSSPPPASTYSSPPVATTFKQEPFDTDNTFTERPRFTPQFPPISASYVSQIPSPTFPKLSPTSPPYSLHLSSQHQPQPKIFHPPPAQLSSPTKRVRRSASPPLLPTPPPIFYPDTYGANTAYSSPSHNPSLGPPFDFLNPFNPAAIANTAQQYGLDLPSLNTANVNHVRRLSVASILAPVPQDALYSYSNRVSESTNNHLDYSNQNVTYGIANGDHNVEDDDIEEIPRYDLDGNGFGDAFRYRMTAASTYHPTSLSIPRGLDPLPPMLVENDKNMMYFKHFLGFTAGLLVPHDCSENPFKKVLPQSMTFPLSRCRPRPSCC